MPRSQKLDNGATKLTATNSVQNQSRERKLDPDQDADEIISSGKWQPYANRIVNNGKWKTYFCKYTKRWVRYTFEEAARIEEHRMQVDKKRLSELTEKSKALPPLSEEEKRENERLYWSRIHNEVRLDQDNDG